MAAQSLRHWDGRDGGVRRVLGSRTGSGGIVTRERVVAKAVSVVTRASSLVSVRGIGASVVLGLAVGCRRGSRRSWR